MRIIIATITIVLSVLIAIGTAETLYDHNADDVLTLFRHRPACSSAVAVTLPSSWETPWTNGVTVWMCR